MEEVIQIQVGFVYESFQKEKKFSTNTHTPINNLRACEVHTSRN